MALHVNEDWKLRQFIEAIELQTRKCIKFLNDVQQNCKHKISTINERIISLERKLDFIEQTIKNSDPSKRNAKKQSFQNSIFDFNYRNKLINNNLEKIKNYNRNIQFTGNIIKSIKPTQNIIKSSLNINNITANNQNNKPIMPPRISTSNLPKPPNRNSSEKDEQKINEEKEGYIMDRINGLSVISEQYGPPPNHPPPNHPPPIINNNNNNNNNLYIECVHCLFDKNEKQLLKCQKCNGLLNTAITLGESIELQSKLSNNNCKQMIKNIPPPPKPQQLKKIPKPPVPKVQTSQKIKQTIKHQIENSISTENTPNTENTGALLPQNTIEDDETEDSELIRIFDRKVSDASQEFEKEEKEEKQQVTTVPPPRPPPPKKSKRSVKPPPKS